jgi:hypothetical protein
MAIFGALPLTMLLAALLWVLISIPIATALDTVNSFGQSGLGRFHGGRRPVGQRARPMPSPHEFNSE